MDYKEAKDLYLKLKARECIDILGIWIKKVLNLISLHDKDLERSE